MNGLKERTVLQCDHPVAFLYLDDPWLKQIWTSPIIT